MRAGKVEREHRVDDNESLVVLRLDERGVIKHYVTMVKHIPGEAVQYYASEIVDESEVVSIFSMRTMFNGRNRDKLINKGGIVDLDATTITLPI
jgi:hypothetical protein